ncbi:MAG: prepilin peptidase [Clostridia bacterium]|nr:prepilin peptidase [Clostridia bacterium]
MAMGILGGVLGGATFFDLKTKKIPNFYIIGLLILGVFFSISIKKVGCSENCLSLIPAFFIAYPLYYYRVLGAGDVKLFIAIKFYLTLYYWLMLISISLMVAAAFFLIRLLLIGELNFNSFHYYRFTPYILLAYFILLVVF